MQEGDNIQFVLYNGLFTNVCVKTISATALVLIASILLQQCTNIWHIEHSTVSIWELLRLMKRIPTMYWAKLWLYLSLPKRFWFFYQILFVHWSWPNLNWGALDINMNSNAQYTNITWKPQTLPYGREHFVPSLYNSKQRNNYHPSRYKESFWLQEFRSVLQVQLDKIHDIIFSDGFHKVLEYWTVTIYP